jgi:hypothetical protein
VVEIDDWHRCRYLWGGVHASGVPPKRYPTTCDQRKSFLSALRIEVTDFVLAELCVRAVNEAGEEEVGIGPSDGDGRHLLRPTLLCALQQGLARSLVPRKVK